MTDRKVLTSIRLSRAGRTRLTALARVLGVSQSDVLELALRLLAKREEVE